MFGNMPEPEIPEFTPGMPQPQTASWSPQMPQPSTSYDGQTRGAYSYGNAPTNYNQASYIQNGTLQIPEPFRSPNNSSLNMSYSASSSTGQLHPAASVETPSNSHYIQEKGRNNRPTAVNNSSHGSGGCCVIM